MGFYWRVSFPCFSLHGQFDFTQTSLVTNLMTVPNNKKKHNENKSTNANKAYESDWLLETDWEGLQTL